MTILLRVLLNSNKTQMSQNDSKVIHDLICSSVHVLLGSLVFMIIQIMHFIYFFVDNLHSAVKVLVHRKENDINACI
jgi:hypothetical protein